MRNVFVFVFALLAGLVCINDTLWAGDDSGELKAKLEKMNAEFAEAFVAGDVEKVYSYYTDDAVSMPNYGPMVKGKEQMIKNEKEMRAAGFKVHSFKLNSMDMWSCGDMVYEIGTYTISLTLPGMENQIDDNGKYLNIFHKGSDGSLKLKYEMWNTDINPWMTDEPKGAAEKDDK